MKYNRFEDVPVWQAGIELTTRIFAITEDRSFRYKGDIANQIQRAALSVPNNIAEGFERGTTQELITFLYYSKGSAGEVRSICHVIDRLPAFDHLKSEISHLKSLAESISRQLSAWARSLQDSDIEGPRRLTDTRKAAYEQKKRADAFMASLRSKHGKEIEANIKRHAGTDPVP
jgi:four helix bundle protein